MRALTDSQFARVVAAVSQAVDGLKETEERIVEAPESDGYTPEDIANAEKAVKDCEALHRELTSPPRKHVGWHEVTQKEITDALCRTYDGVNVSGGPTWILRDGALPDGAVPEGYVSVQMRATVMKAMGQGAPEAVGMARNGWLKILRLKDPRVTLLYPDGHRMAIDLDSDG